MVLSTYTLDAYDMNARVMGLGVSLRFLLSAVFALLTVVFVTYLLGTPFSNQFGRGVLIGAFASWTLTCVGLRWLLSGWHERHLSRSPWLVLINSERVEKFKEDVAEALKLHTFNFVSDWQQLNSQLNGSWSGLILAHSGDAPIAMLTTLLHKRIDGLNVVTVEDFYEGMLQKMPVGWLETSKLMTAGGFRFFSNPVSHRIKRILDILLVLLIAPIALVLVAISGLIILLESGFPIFYSQERVGLNGKAFSIRKLRTMVKDAEKAGAQWAQKKDARITKVGHFMRKTRLDELPQAWNIFVGDMSFIGPRPERPEFSRELEKKIPYYGLRISVRPGLTGWAQVCFRYGASEQDAESKLEYDLYYIKNYSLTLDFSILFKTIRVVLFGAGR